MRIRSWSFFLTIVIVASCGGRDASCPAYGGDQVPLDAAGLDRAPGDAAADDASPDIPADVPTADVAADGVEDATVDGDVESSQDPPWTIMIYLNGDNDLCGSALADLDEMDAALWSEQVRVVVLVDTLFGGAKDMLLGPEGFETLEELGEIDMSDWTELRDFGLRSVEAFPAQRYALILWDHGDGWSKPSPPRVKALSNDFGGAYQEISVAAGELTAALQPIAAAVGAPLDLLGFDMCLMGMWEVAVAAGGSAKIMVASQETSGGDGWNYSGILSFLTEDPGMDAAHLAELMAILYYGGLEEDAVTIAAIALDGIPALTEVVGALGEVLMEDPGLFPFIEQARQEVQWFDQLYSTEEASSFRDLRDLADRLDAALPEAPALQAATAAVRDALDAAVLINFAQETYPGANGLSIHFPGLDHYFPPSYLGEEAPWSGCPWTAFVDGFSTAISAEWTCSGWYFGAGDGCDCACGAWDPDCEEDPYVYGCWNDDDVCVPPGLCQAQEGPCEEGATQCAGIQTLTICQDGAWSATPCVDFVSCPTPGPVGGAICGVVDPDGEVACACYDDPILCAGVECGDNGLGQWCGPCDSGWLCWYGTCEAQGDCPDMLILDCNGVCGNPAWLGDGECDYGLDGADFDCAEFEYDWWDC